MMKQPACPIQTLNQFRDDHPEINLIRFQWQDYSGVLRARVLVLEDVVALIAAGKPIQAAGIAIDCTVNNIILHRSPPRGMYWAIPDWSSLGVASHPGTALVMCALDYEQHNSVRSDLCPRQALNTVLEEANKTWGLDFLVGFEVEFTVMKPSTCSDTMVRCSEGFGLFSVAGLRDPCYQHVEQCVHQLRAQGVEILAVHTEGMRGQYEIVLGPLPPTQAIDQLILVHDYLKDIFLRHGYTVTMSPKPVQSEPLANGQHMHLSLQPASPPLEESFLAGILKRLPSLCGFCLPLEVSYARLKPNEAGFSVAWGTDSRLVPIRKVKPSHWEIRCIDVTANMYCTLAAILGAGLLGLAGKESLIWPDLGVPENQASECSEPLPQCLEDSLEILDADIGSLATMIGRPMIDHYVKIKRFEMAQVKKIGSKATRELLIELF